MVKKNKVFAISKKKEQRHIKGEELQGEKKKCRKYNGDSFQGRGDVGTLGHQSEGGGGKQKGGIFFKGEKKGEKATLQEPRPRESGFQT